MMMMICPNCGGTCRAESKETSPPVTSLDALRGSLNELEKMINSIQYIFRSTEEIEKFARAELNMVDRDDVAAIAIQELHMTPEREEDP